MSTRVRRHGAGGPYGSPIHVDDLRAELKEEIAAAVRAGSVSGVVSIGGQEYAWRFMPDPVAPFVCSCRKFCRGEGRCAEPFATCEACSKGLDAMSRREEAAMGRKMRRAARRGGL